MAEPQTQTQMQPPRKPPGATATAFEDDDIRDIGDRIAALTVSEAKELSEYLKGVL